ncbi:lipoprotein involved with copper homeostasis and adhesion [Bacteroidia bacterium]|nr:lipoprotein involved with copper homeostasis and adhesion [Bacteroidia bacterium]GHT78686.1 lipoprotein involved with copper homeostasis and adhesion [Bacteroidia bacterium]
MKKILLVIGIFSLMVGVSACKQKEKTQDTIEITSMADNSRNSLEWYGTYTGVIPCADCEGIKTQVILTDSNTYTIRREYLGKKEAVYTYSGTFTWSEDGGSISLKEDEREAATRFKVGENVLFQLDGEGKEITGDLANNYILVKVNTD